MPNMRSAVQRKASARGRMTSMAPVVSKALLIGAKKNRLTESDSVTSASSAIKIRTTRPFQIASVSQRLKLAESFPFLDPNDMGVTFVIASPLRSGIATP
jgi:hypothetical protein